MRRLITLMLLGLVGCSSVQKLAVKGVTPIFVEGSNKLTYERSWDFFREASPSNIQLVEMLYLQDTKNLDLLTTLIKTYAGYTYAVPETLAFGDELSGVDHSIHKQNAILYYTKTLDYGLSYFLQKGITKNDLLTLDESKLHKKINEKLSTKDLTAALFTAQAWFSLINLQKDNVALISQIPRAKIVIDWVCSKDDGIENGVCDMFYAQYEGSRPKMLGGNPEKGKELYTAAIKKRPKHLLIRVNFIQNMVLPGFDDEAYAYESKILKEEFAKWENINRDTLVDTSEYKSVSHLNLFNAIALKRFEFMEKNKTKIFGE